MFHNLFSKVSQPSKDEVFMCNKWNTIFLTKSKNEFFFQTLNFCQIGRKMTIFVGRQVVVLSVWLFQCTCTYDVTGIAWCIHLLIPLHFHRRIHTRDVIIVSVSACTTSLINKLLPHDQENDFWKIRIHFVENLLWSRNFESCFVHFENILTVLIVSHCFAETSAC